MPEGITGWSWISIRLPLVVALYLLLEVARAWSRSGLARPEGVRALRVG